MRIVFLDRDTIAPQIVLRRPDFPHQLIEYPRTKPEEAAERLADAEIAIVNKVRLDGVTLSRLPKLRLIAISATGTDNVDKEWCLQHGIAVCNIRGYAVNTVPEHTFALILALRRAIVAYRADVLAGEWKKADQYCFFHHRILDLNGARLGIFGGGSLGGRVAELGRAFGMDVVFGARKGQTGIPKDRVPFDEVLATSDVITLHCPLTPETRGMIGMAEFRTMTKRPLLINASRGGLVVEADVGPALEQGLISGAGFDVTDGEPPADDNPLMAIAHRPDVILTPHVAWASDEAMTTLANQLIDNIENFVRGAPTNLVVDPR